MKKPFLFTLLFLPACVFAQTEEVVTVSDEPTLIATQPEQEEPAQEEPVQEEQQALAFRFGLVSEAAILTAMPEYALVEQEMAKLNADFEAEARRASDEFNAKYETFLTEQRNYAQSIMRKRQQELEEMMRSNENFRIESHRMIREAREEALKPLRQKVRLAINAVAAELNLLFVLNTDADAVPYYLDGVGTDITDAVLRSVTQ